MPMKFFSHSSLRILAGVGEELGKKLDINCGLGRDFHFYNKCYFL